jgi:putative glutamine amidotransferase
VSKPPLIGISGRRRAVHLIRGFPQNFAILEADVSLAAYVECVTLAGGLAVNLSISTDPVQLVKRLDGVVLTGGSDIDPRAYGSAPHPMLDDVEPDRDAFEIALARASIAEGVPLLAICRGLQILNVAMGGTLHQHIEGHAAWRFPVDALLHEVDFAPGTLCAQLYGASASVNTLHHQSIDRVADGLVVAGRSPDGTIEAIEHSNAAALGVQWHPELVKLQPDPSFVWLIDQAGCQERVTSGSA